MQADGIGTIDESLSGTRSRAKQRTANPLERAGGQAHAVWLSASNGDAAARRGDGQSQATEPNHARRLASARRRAERLPSPQPGSAHCCARQRSVAVDSQQSAHFKKSLWCVLQGSIYSGMAMGAQRCSKKTRCCKDRVHCLIIPPRGSTESVGII